MVYGGSAESWGLKYSNGSSRIRLESSREVIFEEIWTKFPQVMKDKCLQAENSLQFLNRINKIKSILIHVEVKL